MRRAAKVDESQPGIVRACRAVGADVVVLPGGAGKPDLLVGFRGANYLLECKTPERAREHKAHRAHQARWHELWPGRRPVVCETPHEALVAIGAIAA